MIKLSKTEQMIMSEIARTGMCHISHGLIRHSGKRGPFGARMVAARNSLVAKGLIRIVKTYSEADSHRGFTNVIHDSIVVAAG